MKINNDCSIENIGFLLYMQNQEKKQCNDNGGKIKKPFGERADHTRHEK